MSGDKVYTLEDMQNIIRSEQETMVRLMKVCKVLMVQRDNLITLTIVAIHQTDEGIIVEVA